MTLSYIMPFSSFPWLHTDLLRSHTLLVHTTYFHKAGLESLILHYLTFISSDISATPSLLIICSQPHPTWDLLPTQKCSHAYKQWPCMRQGLQTGSTFFLLQFQEMWIHVSKLHTIAVWKQHLIKRYCTLCLHFKHFLVKFVFLSLEKTLQYQT